MRCETDPFLCIITRACSASLDNERCSDRFVADYALDPILRFSRFKRFRPCSTDTVLLLRASRFRLGLASFGSMVHPTLLNSLLRISLDCSVSRSRTLLSDLRRSVDLHSHSQLWIKSFRLGGDLILLPAQLGAPRFLKTRFLPPQFSLSLPSLIRRRRHDVISQLCFTSTSSARCCSRSIGSSAHSTADFNPDQQSAHLHQRGWSQQTLQGSGGAPFEPEGTSLSSWSPVAFPL